MLSNLILCAQMAFAVPIQDEASKDKAASLLFSASDSTPYGRLIIAMTALENKADESTIFALASTHPQIAEMLLQENYQIVLEYLLHIPSTERYKLRNGEAIIRTLEQMDKIEKKYATILAKHLGLPKKINAIRIGSFDGVTIEVAVSYKKNGEVLKKNIQMAGPNAPYADQQSRNRIGSIIGVKPSPPLEGTYKLLPLSSGSFEQGLYNWKSQSGFRFDASQPIGVVGLDDNIAMDGSNSLRFYNTEKTRVFETMQQNILLQDANEVRLQCFVKADNTRIEFHQDPSYTYIALQFRDEQGELLQENKEVIRLGTYPWEAILIDASVPQNTITVDIVLLSSVSGTLWFDGITFIQRNE
jgi:hypothetical protein